MHTAMEEARPVRGVHREVRWGGDDGSRADLPPSHGGDDRLVPFGAFVTTTSDMVRFWLSYSSARKRLAQASHSEVVAMVDARQSKR